MGEDRDDGADDRRQSNDAAPAAGTPPAVEPPPSLRDTQMGVARQFAQAEARVSPLDADRLRALVGSKLFGTAADPVRIGRFTVLRRLGSGGMGVVYAAYDEQLDRKVAIKLLHSREVTERQRARLLREAQALARLSHPNVIQVYEVGTVETQVFVAMEFVKGHTLRDYDPQAPLERVLEKYVQAGRGLAAAHAAGLVHRDFKPENALVGDDDRVRVLDFGLARAADGMDSIHDSLAAEEQEELARVGISASSDSLDAPLTRTGAIMGTPAYMSPEQHLGLAAGPATDQFSFCVALWERIYGQRPFAGETPAALAVAVTSGKLREPPPGRAVPAWLRRALLRGLAVEPESRYPSMDALLAALSRDRRLIRRIGIVSALALAGGLAVYAAARADADDNACADPTLNLTGVWDEPTREAVHQAFTASGVPSAEDAWRGTARQLDQYTQGWAEMHTEACEAHLVRSEDSAELYGRRMVCLGQRLRDLGQLTALLREAEAETVLRAVEAAGNLAPLGECADATRLMASESLDADTRTRVEEIDRMLGKAAARQSLGQYKDGLDVAREAVAAARAITHPRTEARALYALGQLQGHVHELPQAEETLRQAVRKADQAGDDRTRVRAAIELIKVVGYQQADFEEGQRLAEDARAALDRVGQDPRLEAYYYTQLGSMALARSDYAQAAEHHQVALRLRESELGGEHTEVAMSLNNLGNAMTSEGRHAEAEAAHRRAQRIFEATVGPEHPYVAISLNNIANNLLEQGRRVHAADRARADERYREAEDLYRRAIAIRERNFGSDHAVVSRTVHNLGEALRRQRKYAEALAQLERALAIKEKAEGADHPSVAITLTGIGRSHLGLNRPDRAVEALERALAIWRARGNQADPADVGETSFALASAVQTSDPARARTLATEARAAYEKAGPDRRAELAEVDAWLTEHAPGR